MILLYESYACLSCRKAKEWLEKNQLDYIAINIEKKRLNVSDIKYLLYLADDIYDVISVRSKAVKNFKKDHGFDLEDLTTSRLIEFIQEHPSAMRRPLITNGHVLVSGWDEDEITALLPKEKPEFRRKTQV